MAVLAQPVSHSEELAAHLDVQMRFGPQRRINGKVFGTDLGRLDVHEHAAVGKVGGMHAAVVVDLGQKTHWPLAGQPAEEIVIGGDA